MFSRLKNAAKRGLGLDVPEYDFSDDPELGRLFLSFELLEASLKRYASFAGAFVEASAAVEWAVCEQAWRLALLRS